MTLPKYCGQCSCCDTHLDEIAKLKDELSILKDSTWEFCPKCSHDRDKHGGEYGSGVYGNQVCYAIGCECGRSGSG
jgi:hypothetical protein